MSEGKLLSDFQEDCKRTQSSDFFGGDISLKLFADILMDCQDAIKRLDHLKKALFYGKQLPGAMMLSNCIHLPTSGNVERFIDQFPTRQEGLNITQSVIGMATESGELLECLFKFGCDGTHFDINKAIDETGDSLFYQGQLANTINVPLSRILALNTEKRKMRFPKGFVVENALTPNHKKESEIFKNG